MKIYKLMGDWRGMRGMRARGYFRGAADMASLTGFGNVQIEDYGNNAIVISTNQPHLVDRFKNLFPCEIERLEKY